jgi:flagellar biosynthesis protein FliQ
MPLYVQLLHIAFATELSVLAPIVFLLLAVGFATSFLQASLQIEDATFALLPKTIAMVFIVLAGGLGLLGGLQRLAVDFISHAPALVHQPWS